MAFFLRLQNLFSCDLEEAHKKYADDSSDHDPKEKIHLRPFLFFFLIISKKNALIREFALFRSVGFPPWHASFVRR